VKRTGAGVSTYTRAIDDLTAELKAKKPLNALRLHNRNTTPPVSRSNSGSSVAATPVVNKPKPKPLGGASFKENNGHGTATITTTGRPLGFMRPTASSTAKDSIDGGGGIKPKTLVKKTFK